MKADPLMRYFADLRTSIEKKATTPTAASLHIRSFSSSDIGRFKPAPPGATSFFMGDQSGGVGWEVKRPDGSSERYYVELPPDIGTIELHLPEAPAQVAQGRSAVKLVEEYLAKVEALVREARARFLPKSD